ncbi:MAG: response regulator transcription factor [Steroidobacteraceae bacterium]
MQSFTASPITILVVDDHGIVRHGLSSLLDGHEGMRVVGAAGDGEEAVTAAERLHPDVIVMDLALPKLSGVDAALRILASQPAIRIVILSAWDTSEHVFRALRAGARGYVLKESAVAEILQAVTAVCKGDRYLSPRLSSFVLDGMPDFPRKLSPMQSLSCREREVMQLALTGASSSEIGKRLSLSRKTVDTYRCRLMGKLGVPNFAGLMRFAVANAIAPP